VAIAGTLAGLASAFIPGVGVREHPAPEVTMTVREVHSRITRGVYKTDLGQVRRPARLAPATAKAVMRGEADNAVVSDADVAALNDLEIGNVAWVEMHFKGYRGHHLKLQWALFRPEPGGALIPDTEYSLGLPDAGASDESSQFRPIWIGTPRVPAFRAEFRIVEAHEVRQMASTGTMRGLTYRYACPLPKKS
jgi:hypothetical protein